MQWWWDAVVAQIVVPSFSDGDGDGVGDLAGIAERLGYLELLGADALRLSPLDAAPPGGTGGGGLREVAPAFGDLAGFDALLTAAHRHDLRLVLDLPLHHTAAEHPWFRAALGAAPGSSHRTRYHFRHGRGGGPPDDRRCAGGGAAWTRVSDGQWYRHLSAPDRPDLDWANPEVWADLERTLRFWIERGVDGFVLDLARDDVDAPAGAAEADRRAEIVRAARSVLDHFPGRLLGGLVPATRPTDADGLAGPDRTHLVVDPRLADVPFDADAIRTAVQATIDSAVGLAGAAADETTDLTVTGTPPTTPDAVPGATSTTADPGHDTGSDTGNPAIPTWALSTPDTSRPPTRYGGGERGVQRSRAMLLLALALPGSVHLLAGDELALPDGPGGTLGRGPVPWEGPGPGYGFTAGTPWTPLPSGAEQLGVDAQLEDTRSTLSLVRRAIAVRRRHAAFAGAGAPEWFGAPDGCLAFRRDGSTLVCAVNASGFPVPLPPGDVLLVSGRLDGDLLPPDTAAWLT